MRRPMRISTRPAPRAPTRWTTRPPTTCFDRAKARGNGRLRVQAPLLFRLPEVEQRHWSKVDHLLGICKVDRNFESAHWISLVSGTLHLDQPPVGPDLNGLVEQRRIRFGRHLNPCKRQG